MSDQDQIEAYLAQSREGLNRFAADPAQRRLLGDISDAIVAALGNGGKLLIAGNGGSAADAQHLAAEFTGRMLYTRAPLAAVALTTDTSALTAIGNDFGFDAIFARQVRALGRRGDVLLALSTSGNSPNVLQALDAAGELGMVRVGFCGTGPGEMEERTDFLLRVPATLTPVVQQIHMVAGHILCVLAERALCPQPG